MPTDLFGFPNDYATGESWDYNSTFDSIESILRRRGESVLAHGATGDGTTDDTSAIQSALNSASVVYLPAGTYSITDTLSVGSSQLIGDGWEQTTISVDAQLGRAVDVSTAGGRVAGFRVAGNDNAIEGVGLQAQNTGVHRVAVADISQWGSETSTAAGIVTLSATNVSVTDCFVDGVHAPNNETARGIRVGGIDTASAVVSGCRVNDVTPVGDSDGIVIQADDGHTRVANNYVTNAAKSSLKVQMPGGHTTVTGNILGWGDPAGPSIVRILDTSATVVGNLIKQSDTASEAVRIGDDAHDVTFAGNTVAITNASGTTDGIRVRAGSDNATVTDGTVDLNGGGRHGVMVAGATGVSVGDMTIRNTGERGINLEGPASASVTGCNIIGAGAHGVFVAGDSSGVVVTGNTIESAFEAVSDNASVAAVGTNATL